MGPKKTKTVRISKRSTKRTSSTSADEGDHRVSDSDDSDVSVFSVKSANSVRGRSTRLKTTGMDLSEIRELKEGSPLQQNKANQPINITPQKSPAAQSTTAADLPILQIERVFTLEEEVTNPKDSQIEARRDEIPNLITSTPRNSECEIANMPVIGQTSPNEDRLIAEESPSRSSIEIDSDYAPSDISSIPAQQSRAIKTKTAMESRQVQSLSSSEEEQEKTSERDSQNNPLKEYDKQTMTVINEISNIMERISEVIQQDPKAYARTKITVLYSLMEQARNMVTRQEIRWLTRVRLQACTHVASETRVLAHAEAQTEPGTLPQPITAAPGSGDEHTSPGQTAQPEIVSTACGVETQNSAPWEAQGTSEGPSCQVFHAVSPRDANKQDKMSVRVFGQTVHLGVNNANSVYKRIQVEVSQPNHSHVPVGLIHLGTSHICGLVHKQCVSIPCLGAEAASQLGQFFASSEGWEIVYPTWIQIARGKRNKLRAISQQAAPTNYLNKSTPKQQHLKKMCKHPLYHICCFNVTKNMSF